jgi:hypothetical protein
MLTFRSLLLQGVQLDTTEDTDSRFIRTHLAQLFAQGV